jgi:nucleoid DNA-binding protein
MIKIELVDAIATEVNVNKVAVKAVLVELFKQIEKALVTEGEVTLRELGTFKVSEKAERYGRNPKTGETIMVSARKSLTFKAGTKIKKAINS